MYSGSSVLAEMILGTRSRPPRIRSVMMLPFAVFRVTSVFAISHTENETGLAFHQATCFIASSLDPNRPFPTSKYVFMVPPFGSTSPRVKPACRRWTLRWLEHVQKKVFPYAKASQLSEL